MVRLVDLGYSVCVDSWLVCVIGWCLVFVWILVCCVGLYLVEFWFCCGLWLLVCCVWVCGWLLIVLDWFVLLWLCLVGLVYGSLCRWCGMWLCLDWVVYLLVLLCVVGLGLLVMLDRLIWCVGFDWECFVGCGLFWLLDLRCWWCLVCGCCVDRYKGCFDFNCVIL